MINFFNNQVRNVMVQGKGVERMVFTRTGKTISIHKLNTQVMVLLQENSKVTEGDIVVDGTAEYLVSALIPAFVSTQAKLFRVNAQIEIMRIVKSFTLDGVQKGLAELHYTNMPTFQETVTAAMRQYDAGLLPSTVKKFIIPICDMQLGDRIKLDNDVYQVDVVDNSTYQGLLGIQCSIDKRVIT